MSQRRHSGFCAGLSSRYKACRNAVRKAAQGACEHLERRQLLSSVTFTGGVLTLMGDANARNRLYVDVAAGGKYLATANGHSRKVAQASLKSIVIKGGALADRVWINTKIKVPANIQTLGGSDYISSGNGSDSISAGAGNDVIIGRGGNDTIIAGDGNDYLEGDAGKDSLVGGAGNDTFLGGAGADMLDGGTGKNVFRDRTKTDLSPSGTTTTPTTPTGPTKPTTPTTTDPQPNPSTNPTQNTTVTSISFVDGVLTLTGATNVQNHLYVDLSGTKKYLATANGKNLTIAKSALKSIVVVGGSLADRVWINTAIKVPANIQTLGGNDYVSSGSGNDSIVAGDGNDEIYGRGGNDTITAGDGNDTIYGGDGNDLISSGDGGNVVYGENGDDIITTGAGKDSLIGGAGNDSLSSGDGDDYLEGDSGTDTLLGGNGNDTVAGGAGADQLNAGIGSNTYPDLSSTDSAPSGIVGSPSPQDSTEADGGLVLGGVADTDTIITGSNNGDATAPTPVIDIKGTSGIGPLSVFVHALNSTLGSGDPLMTHYQWDFGDADGRFNSLVGWNAAHIYDTPGVYQITLTVTNQLGKSNTVSTTVTVTADTRRSIYVDTSGSDLNDGSSPDTAVRTVVRAIQLVGSGVRLLFHTGQTFNMATSITLPFHDVLIGSYGDDGSDPVLMRTAGPGTSTISMFANTANVVVQDIVIDSPWKVVGNIANKMPADGIFVGGSDIAIRRCTFLNLDNAIDGDRNPSGTLVQDCSAPLSTGLRGCFIWGQGTDQVYLGNTVANSTREHIVRTVGVTRELIAYNDFTNLDRSSVDPSDYNKGVVDVHVGAYAYVAQNYLYDGELRTGPRGAAGEPLSDITDWTVFEGNHIFDHEIQIYPGTQHLMIRNNIMTMVGGCCISIVPSDTQGRNIVDIQILNNTGLTSGPGGQFLYLFGGATKQSVTVSNNLWIAPDIISGQHATAGIFVSGKDLSAFDSISNNVWQMPGIFSRYGLGGVMYIWPVWSDQRGFITPEAWDALTPVDGDQFANTSVDDDYTPDSSSVAAVAGRVVYGVFDDLYGNLRPANGIWSAGAVQA